MKNVPINSKRNLKGKEENTLAECAPSSHRNLRQEVIGADWCTNDPLTDTLTLTPLTRLHGIQTP